MATIVRSNANKLADRNRSRSVKIAQSARKGLEACRTPTEIVAKGFSSGSVPQSDFNASPGKNPHANHPYGYGPKNSRGARGAIPYGDPGVLNSQSHELENGWETSISASKTSGQLVLFNATDHSKLIKASNDKAESGVGVMVYRPILENVHKILDRPFTETIRAVYQSALKAF